MESIEWCLAIFSYGKLSRWGEFGDSYNMEINDETIQNYEASPYHLNKLASFYTALMLCSLDGRFSLGMAVAY